MPTVDVSSGEATTPVEDEPDTAASGTDQTTDLESENDDPSTVPSEDEGDTNWLLLGGLGLVAAGGGWAVMTARRGKDADGADEA